MVSNQKKSYLEEFKSGRNLGMFKYTKRLVFEISSIKKTCIGNFRYEQDLSYNFMYNKTFLGIFKYVKALSWKCQV